MAESAKRYNSVLDIIDKRLIPDDEAKKARGEVFTPLNLVREILFGLRKSAANKSETEIWGIDKEGNFFDDDEKDRVGGIPLEIWRDPETKWLDPANGIGNFPVVAFYMLDYQIGNHGPPQFKGDNNKVKRRRHIIKNMLFMIELNKGNVNTSIKIFEKIVPGVTANICCANTLEMTDEKLKKDLGVNRFHVVMGNPPFNSDGTKGEGKQIWPKFINNCIKLLSSKKDDSKDSYIIFITPPNWRNLPALENKKEVDYLLEKIKSINLLHLTVLASHELKLHFEGIQQPMDYYLIQNTPYEGTTTIYDLYKNLELVDISTFPVIPNYGYNIFKDFLEVKPKLVFDNIGFNINTDAGKKFLKESKSNEYKYPIIKSIIKDGKYKIIYSKKEHPYQNKQKVLVSDDANLYPSYDTLCGTSQHVFSMEVENEKQGYSIIKLLNSKLYQYVLNSLKIIGRGVSVRILNILPYINDNIKSDSDLYSKFKLREEDIKSIDSNKEIKTSFNTEIRITRKNMNLSGGYRFKPRRTTRKVRRT
jgi:hypothetical protein